MKFTILITSYNKEKYLEECIRSCLSQSIKNYEIIICDNFSEDGTNKILSKFKKHIKIIKKKRVSGSGPINQIDLIKEGLTICKGEYICLLDGDDYYHQDKLKILQKKFKNKKSLNVIFDIPVIKKNNNLSQFKLKKKYQKNIWPTIINTSSITLKKDFLKNLFENQLFQNFNLLEIDFRLNIYVRIIDKNFTIISDKLTVYRYVEGSIINNIKKFSKKWWVKRLQAHNFMKYILESNNLYYKYNFDWFCSKILSIILPR